MIGCCDNCYGYGSSWNGEQQQFEPCQYCQTPKDRVQQVCERLDASYKLTFEQLVAKNKALHEENEKFKAAMQMFYLRLVSLRDAGGVFVEGDGDDAACSFLNGVRGMTTELEQLLGIKETL